jgi:uncharacterized membrane protein
VVASFGFLVFYSHRIAASIQNPDLIARIVDDIRREVVHAIRTPGKPDPIDVVETQVSDGAPVQCAESGYVQGIEHARIVAEAANADAVVHVFFRPGQFVLRGERLASIWPPERAKRLTTCVEDGIKLGRHRTLQQDAEFGIAQIVEIAIRALSPAVNDTFTGVACVDWIADALLVLADGPSDDGVWFDAAGKSRLLVRAVRLERLVRLAFDQIRQAAADNPAVLVRILDVIRRVAPRMPDAAREALRDEANAIREVAAAKIAAAIDRRDVEAAWERASAP